MNYTILYEDTDLIVCTKPAGIASQDEKGIQPALTDLLKQHLTKQSNKKGNPYLGIVHRLDKPVGGVMIYAKNKTAAAALSKQITNNQIKKHYYAVLCNVPKESSATLTNFLSYDKKNNRSIICTSSSSEAKKAELSYQIIDQVSLQQENQNSPSSLTLVDILLKTGRHHQIRVQFSHIGCPLYGDLKYNSVPELMFFSSQKISSIALYSYCLEFFHPKTKEIMQFSCLPTGEIWNLFPVLSSADLSISQMK